MPLYPSTSIDSSQQDPSKVGSGIANVFRSFRGLNRAGFSLPSTPASQLPGSSRSSSHNEYFSDEPTHHGQLLVEKLKPSNPLNDRIVAAETLRTIIADYPVSTITEIWSNAQDLVDDDNPLEARQAALKLLTACIQQHEPSSLDRLKFYRIIALHDSVDDFFHQLQAMLALTNGGRDLSTFEREIGGLISNWLKIWFREATFARQTRKREGGSSENLSGAEFCLKELFNFIVDIIKFNHKAFEEREVQQLLTDVLAICKRTTSKNDIECSIAFIEALITYGYVPRPTLKGCIEVLSSAYATLRDLAEVTWNAVSNLCKSYMAHNSILVLREILETPLKRHSLNTNTLRGAVWFLEKILIANEKDGLPPVQFSFVMSAFQSALSANSIRLELEICKAISSILATRDVVSQIAFDEWAVPLDILVRCSKRTTERADGTPLDIRLVGNDDSPSRGVDRDGLPTAISQSLFQIIDHLESACQSPDFGQLEGVVDFFVRVHGHLPDSAAELVINYYTTEHLCYPSCSDWLTNCQTLIDIFFKNPSRPSTMRINVLSLIKNVYETIRDVCEENLLRTLVMVVFDDLQIERDPKVLEAMVKMMVDVAGDSNMTLFKDLIEIFINYLGLENSIIDGSSQLTLDKDGTKSSSRPPSGIPSGHHDIITRGIVMIFIRNVNDNVAKTVRVYEELVKIAGSKACDVDARLTAMRLLFRLRADSENSILIVEETESHNLASAVGRTIKLPGTTNSVVSTPQEEPSSTRANRSGSVSQNSFLFRNSTSRMTVERAKKRVLLWTYPEKDPLPEKPKHESSHILLTFYDPPSDIPSKEGPSLDPKTALRMSLWMEQVIPIIQKGCDWEVYSYVLVHLPSQLANKTAFRNCKAHISMLRSYICDQLHVNNIPNTDLPAEVKKADIAVVLIQLLTTLISYHENFAKNETEGIVKAFQLGLHSWQRTAKPCIHALSICCYELPGSTGKFLPGILTKLSQIITSSAVSVHILEFLSALAKLPTLYSNFTEPDFRNIFGIAFRYIQHTKESTAQPSRASYPGRLGSKEISISDITLQSEQPDLPQYVLTLAYNVLSTWFLSLRLSERPKYVSWIIRGLVLHDGSNTVDEQSQVCIDMLQRFTYSEHDLKPPSKIEPRAGLVTKNWLNGMTIFSVQMMTESGISRVVVRRPSGTSYYSLKPESKDSHVQLQARWMDLADSCPNTTDGTTTTTLEKPQQDKVLPSHMLLQLTGGAGPPETRPILLQDDEKTTRALDVLDRVPVVDFHKIGVVYVGAGQTDEKEILSNAMGTPDYTDFIDGLGELITLKGTDRNTGGLDRENDLDGQFAYFWSDRITEIIFHITTMMPTLEHDPQCTMKKRHIGNDFVNIIFNNSGLPWAFGTIPSQFNFVTIIISPEARSGFVSSRLLKRRPEDKIFYRVQVVCKQGFSEISPAIETKMVSGRSLPAFVRNLALNASVYSHVYNEGGGEHISNWRHRLRGINQLRERLGSTPFGSVVGLGGSGGVSSPIQPSMNPRRVSAMNLQTDHSFRSSSAAHINGDADKDSETEDILMSFDFSRFT